MIYFVLFITNRKFLFLKKKIYIADLTHTASGLTSITFPLGTALVTSYAKHITNDSFEFRIFKFHDQLTKAISENPPSILALSNYTWNLEISYKLCAWAKRQNPNLVVVFGGPNFPINKDEKLLFLQQRPVIDFYIENEGETGFVELLKKLEEHNFDITALKRTQEPVANCTYLNGDEIIVGEIARIKDVNIIPSPYLTGILDDYFNLPLVPIIETTRGCPFSCTFCADGLVSKNKVVTFNMDRVRDELYYIAEHIKNIDEIYISDLNFGMYKRDLETAQIISELQSKFNWPARVKATTGKNMPKRMIQIAEELKGSWITGHAIQSSDTEVLKNIKRSNISTEAYSEFSTYMKKLDKKAQVFTEIILGLPGDTKEKHFDTLRYAIDSQTTRIKSFGCMLLPGTEMASKESREKYKLVTKFRIGAGSVGVYKFGEEITPVAETHEIIVASKDMSFDDHISCRVMNLLLEAYYNQAQFEEIFTAIKMMGLSEFDLVRYIHEHNELYTPKVKEIIKKYTSALKENLYDTFEEAEEMALRPDRVDRYISGELGFNEHLTCNGLLYFNMEETLSIMLEALRMFLLEKNMLTSSVQDYFTQLGNFILCKKREFNKFELLLEKSFDYDFEVIDALNYKVDPRNVKRLNKPIHLKFFHNQEQKREISNGLYTHKDHTDGIYRLLYEARLQKWYRNFQESSIPIELNEKNSVLPDTAKKIREQQPDRRSWEDSG